MINGYLIFFSKKYLIKSFGNVFIRLLVFYFLICGNSLNSLHINPLQIICIKHIFSQLEAYNFTHPSIFC